MAGISKELGSSKIQLNLYMKKNNRESKLIDSFTEGTLVIGSAKEINGDDEKEMSLKLFIESSNIRILLFTDITIITKNLINIFNNVDQCNFFK